MKHCFFRAGLIMLSLWLKKFMSSLFLEYLACPLSLASLKEIYESAMSSLILIVSLDSAMIF